MSIDGSSIPSISQQQQQHYPSMYTNYAPASLNRRPASSSGDHNKGYDTSPPGGGGGGGGYQQYRPSAAIPAPVPAEDSEPEEGELEEGEIR
jgi:hypothetical protein